MIPTPPATAVPIEETFGGKCDTIIRPGFLTADALLIFVVTQKVFKGCTNQAKIN